MYIYRKNTNYTFNLELIRFKKKYLNRFIFKGQGSFLRKCIRHGIRNYYSDFTEKCKTSSMLLEVSKSKMEYYDINDGMRLIVEYEESFVTTIGCLLPAGAMFEKSEERGSALFLEHTLFQVKHLLLKKVHNMFV